MAKMSKQSKQTLLLGLAVGFTAAYLILPKSTAVPASVFDSPQPLPRPKSTINGTNIPARIRKSNMPGVWVA